MINSDENNKESAKGAELYTQRPDSNAICESLVSKLTDKNDNKPKSNVKSSYRSDKPEEMSDTEDSEKADEESDWSSATASPAPLKTPRAFEKSDHLYENQLEKEGVQETEDWSWDAEEFLHEDHIIPKDTDNSYKP